MKRFLLLLLATIVIQSVQAQRIDHYLDEIVDLRSFSGSVLVEVKGEVVVNKGYGMSDYENEIPNSPESVHRIGSLTKQFTSMGVMKLIEDSDTISLDDPIEKFIPDLPEDWKPITLFQLLTHTSGLPNYFGDMDDAPVEETYKQIEKVIGMERDKPRGLRNVPGEEFRYSNFGYCMLGYVIEKTSGQYYFDYLEEKILKPLEMDQTFYDDPAMIIQNRSEGYDLKNGVRLNDELNDPAAYAAGGILSSTNDMLKWKKAFTSDMVLSNKSRSQLFEAYKDNYGLGWQILEKNGRTMYNHNGSTIGFNSRIVYYPDDEVYIVILGNNNDVRAAPITCDIEALIFDREDAAVSLPYETEPTSMSKYTGEFKNDSDEQRSIQQVDDVLYYINGESKFEITPIAEDVFCFAKYKEFRIEFRDDDTFVLSTCSVNPRTFVRN